MLGSNFRCAQISENERIDFDHTLIVLHKSDLDDHQTYLWFVEHLCRNLAEVGLLNI
jgi:hypothetical protein